MEKKLAETANKILEFLGVFNVSLDIFLVSDSLIKNINKKYRGKDKTTNILSFESIKEIPYPDKKGSYLGEIYLAPEYISRHNEDMRFILAHGILHLLGYDHEKNFRLAKNMEKKEKEIIEKLLN